MMSDRRLVLIRHAKAVSRDLPRDFPRVDFDRELSELGQQQAELMGRHLAQNGYFPQMVLCSSSLRTKQTWEILIQALNVSLNQSGKSQASSPAFLSSPVLLFSDDLYLSSVSTYRQMLEIVPTKIETVFLIGHNPELELMLDWSLEKRPVLFQNKLSTCALAVIEFKSDSWSLKRKTGRCILATSPKHEGLRTNRV